MEGVTLFPGEQALRLTNAHATCKLHCNVPLKSPAGVLVLAHVCVVAESGVSFDLCYAHSSSLLKGKA